MAGGSPANAVSKLAVWLARSPTNAVLAMVVAMPLAQPLAAAVLVQQTLVHGLRGALVRGGLTLATVALATGIVSPGDPRLAYWSAAVLGVALLVGLTLRRTRSTTLTAQLWLLVAIVVVVVVHASAIDPATIWSGYADYLRRNVGAESSADVAEIVEAMVAMLPEFAVSFSWLAAMIALFLGHSLYALMPGNGFAEGRFRDLNLGRIMAGAMIVSCVLLALAGSAVARGVAVCLLIAFFMQGLALLHWFVARRRAGIGALLAAYVALVLPFLAAVALPTLSVVGYLDAWFGIRREQPAAS